ncbi:MAG: TetR/AcrR family transcriptional regulator [Candidatus Kapabacteria bacterium]|nr:TetR/AcrR family transcriptional regulator [Candidatus Kapabacteria bacterium]MDW8012725.1 TetR/AcrR family transcriptional regulator [Bacteroidota bacterium]
MARRDKEAKRDRLLQAAAELFARKGYHATRVAEIAQRAGVAKGTVYEYFPTKEELFYALLDGWLTRFETDLSEHLAAESDPLRQADIVREAAVQFYRRHAAHAPIFLEFWAHALRSSDGRFLRRIQRFRTFLEEQGHRLTEALVASGVFLPVDVPSLVRLEAGISDGIFLLWVLSGRSFSLERAYVFRQSVLGLGVLSEAARQLLRDRLQQKLREGFLLQLPKPVQSPEP